MPEVKSELQLIIDMLRLFSDRINDSAYKCRRTSPEEVVKKLMLADQQLNDCIHSMLDAYFIIQEGQGNV
mgnify:CR=1 FL=1